MSFTLSERYIPLYASKAREFIITGGRGSGKSFAVGAAVLALTFEKGQRVLYTRQTMNSAHISIIPEFTEKIEMAGMQDKFFITKTEIINLVTGSSIIFKGLKTSAGNQTANLKSLTGVTTWVLDEAEELTNEATFDKIALSVRKKGVQNRIILILNPTTKEHWIYKKYFERAGVAPGTNDTVNNVTYVHTTYADAIDTLDISFLQSIEQMKLNNPQKYKHVILGGWLDAAEGVVFTNWEYGVFVDTGYIVFGQDFGFSVDPTTLIECSIDKAKKTIYVRECYGKAGLTTSEIYDLNLYYTKNKAQIVADSAEPRLIEELKKAGNNIKAAVKGPGSITAGISMLQDYKIIVDVDSTAIGSELNNYVWDDKKSGKPVDMFNHRIDAIRYAVYGRKEVVFI